MKKTILSLILCATFGFLSAQQLTVTQVYTGFSSPVDIKNCGDERLFIVERPGRIRIIDSAGTLQTIPFLNIQTRVLSGGERGLLGLAFDPNYASNGYFYVNYTAQTIGRTHVSRFSVDPSNPDSALPSSEELLLDIYQPYANHNGGHLAFGADGYLYIGMGDGGSSGDPQNRAQNLDSLLGKMLRIDVSNAPGYTIPASNPFVGVAGRDEIWTYGMRNPWRFSFDRITGDLWIGDVGQGAREEVDFQPATATGGDNYGWNCFEGDVTYPASGIVCPSVASTHQPLFAYSHGAGDCSITGGYIYRGAEYANLFGKYFFTDYCLNTIRSLVRNGSTATYTNYGSFAGSDYVSFGENKYGEIFLSSLTGQIYKLGDTACRPVAFLSDLDTLHVCGSSTDLSTPAGRNFTYSWTANGSTVPGNNIPTLHVIQSGAYSVAVTNPALCSNISTEVYVSLDTVPVVSFTGLDTMYCELAAPVTLSGTPAGGTFAGPGITGTQFDPFAAGPGMHSISYSFTTPEGCSSSSLLQTRVAICQGINPLTALQGVSIFPNPATKTCTVQSLRSKILNVEVLDITGRKIFSRIPESGGLMPVVLDISALSAGVYMVQVYTEMGTITEKLKKD